MFDEKIQEILGKLGDLCRANGYLLTVQDKAFPVMFLLREEPNNQLSLTDKHEGEEMASAVDIVFGDRCVVISSGKVILGADDHKKIVNASKKLHYLMMQQYFYEKTHQITELALSAIKGD